MGAMGTMGVAGPAGPAGPMGPAGPTGPAGAVGPAGPEGPAGPVGPAGPTGPAGATGATGAAGAPGAVGPPGPSGTTGQLGQSAFGSAPLTVAPTLTTQTLIPGLTTTITVPASSVVLITSDGAIQTTSAAVNGVSVVDVFFVVDGAVVANGGYQRVVAANTDGVVNTIRAWSMSQVVTVPAGSHTFAVRAVGVNVTGSVDATVSGNNTSPNQGTISAIVLRTI